MIAQIISSMTGIDVGSMTEEDGQKLLGLEDGIHRRVVGPVGQVTAVKALAKAVRRPIGSFLFLGPTGVGQDRSHSCSGTGTLRFCGDDDAHRYVGVR